MEYSEFIAELGKAGLTVSGFANLIGMRANSISNYAKTGGIPDHLAIIATLLGELRVNDIAYERAFSRLDLQKKLPRGGAKKGKFGGNKQVQFELGS
jgi:hypothetical protein